MKKILAVSFGALLVATAANAETTNTGIASVSYVDGQVSAVQTTANTANTNATTANNAIAAMDLSTVGGTTSVVRSVTQTNGKVTATAEAVDTTPTSGSAKLITSGGVSSALSNKQDASTIGTVTATNMGTTATTVVTAIKEVAGEAADAQSTANTASTNATTANNAIAAMDLATVGGTTSVIRSVAQTNGKVTATAEAVDTAPIGGSAKLITSGGVYSGLEEKVDKKQGSENAGKGLIVEETNGTLTLADIATQEELDIVASTAASGQTATQVNTAITNAIGGLDVASVGEAGKFVITIKQENGLIDAGVKSFVDTLSDGVSDAPTTNAVYDALQGKLSTTGTAARATADASGNTITTTYATKTELTTGLNGKLGTSLGSTAASKAVITDTSGNITTGTISSAMITDGTIATADIADSAVTYAKIATNAINSAKISDGSITNADIASTAAIAQSKISGLSTSLAGKQPLVSDGEEGKFYVADAGSGWKDMFEAMPKDRACDEDGVKCALTHKSGVYAWEIVRE